MGRTEVDMTATSTIDTAALRAARDRGVVHLRALQYGAGYGKGDL